MKKAVSLLCASLLVCMAHTTVFSQVPGYMGKRFSAHYDPQFMYAFLAGHFDVHHNASLEYVTSLRHAIGFRYGFSNLKDEYQYEQVVMDSWGYTGYDNVNVDMMDKVQSFTIYAKFFNKRQGFIAPAGAYTALGLCFLHSKAIIQQDINDNGELYSNGETIQTDNNYALYFGKGRQFIAGNRIIINLAAHLGIPLIYRLGGTHDELSNRVAFSYFFRAQLGIGFLAF